MLWSKISDKDVTLMLVTFSFNGAHGCDSKNLAWALIPAFYLNIVIIIYRRNVFSISLAFMSELLVKNLIGNEQRYKN